ncbi:MAG: type VI secretion system baseplate subunit TssF [Desulfobacterales bacterium]|nr:type VI secretion system baseplate subunit TssF [Desulfobacterales bacterium]MCP4158673.1 type VI secretion system baseplate subunit TssF [Deltaproteobacteria bacterium]
MTQTYNDYFKKELHRLKTIGKEFSKENPVLSPMFSGSGTDADVERLLEGVAFLTAGINKKLDDEYPEILHSLVQSVCPQYLQPVPSATMIEFTPKTNLNEVFKIPGGTHIDSIKVGDISCKFSTCFDIDIYPAAITNVTIRENAGDSSRSSIQIKLDFQLNTMNLSEFSLNNIRLFLSGDFHNCSNLFFLLNHYLENITVHGSDGLEDCVLDKDKILSGSFYENDSLYPFPTNVFPSYRVLREFFIFPEKFLNIDLDITSWQNRGDGDRFSITFNCKKFPYQLPEINQETFRLFTVPAVNLFPHEAEPILTEQQESEILVQPASLNNGSYQIFSVDKVTGFERGASKSRDFVPFTGYIPESEENPVYNLIFRPSVTEEQMDINLSIAYPPTDEMPESEIISTLLTCSNGRLPENLQVGEISKAAGNTPELVTFKNISPVTTSYPPPLEDKLLWYLLSYLSINFLSLADSENLKSCLNSCLVSGGRDKVREISNEKKITSVKEVIITPKEFLIKGSLYRGKSIMIKIDINNFGSHGDMYLFGSVLDYFLGSYASMNTVTELVFLDEKNGDKIKWPTRLGTRPLL